VGGGDAGDFGFVGGAAGRGEVGAEVEELVL
jgi:hypothetical protein